MNRNRVGPDGHQSSAIDGFPHAGAWFEATEPYPPLKILPGDLVRYDPTQEWPLEIVRCVANGQAQLFWNAVSTGALRPVCDLNPPEDAEAPLAENGIEVEPGCKTMRIVREN